MMWSVGVNHRIVWAIGLPLLAQYSKWCGKLKATTGNYRGLYEYHLAYIMVQDEKMIHGDSSDNDNLLCTYTTRTVSSLIGTRTNSVCTAVSVCVAKTKG